MGFLFCIGMALGAHGQDITELTIAEQLGVARANEPVRMGIPLAAGVAKDTDGLALVDAAGKPLPCQFREIARSTGDNSLRWVHAVFQASVPANGKIQVKLVKGKAAQSVSKIEVAEAGGTVTINNGVLKLVVKGANFNLFDSVTCAGADVVKPHAEGFVATIGGKAYKPGADSKATIEENGSEGAVIRVSGKLVADDGKGPLEFACYIHVYAGSPVVRVSFSYTNCQGTKAADFVSVEDLSLTLPTALAGGKATAGGEGKNFSGKSAKIVAKTSDLSEISVDDAQAGTAKGKSTKPVTIGWVDLSKGADGPGVAVGLRWFWQMFPKAVEATDDGKLRAALYARECGKPLDVYMGQGRTHYLTFLFHGQTDGKTLSDVFAGSQMPLRAVATPKYYCRDTQVFGPLADSDPSLYPADLADLAKKYDDIIKKSAETITKKIDGCSYQGVTMDSYGYLNWGDLFHWANAEGVTDPWNILWESNYYDYPWAAFLQFLRTGDLMYVDILDRNGLHLADVFMCKWHPQKELRGACRYSPPANHVGNDTDYKAPQPYLSVEFNHHKAQSMLTRYLLLGDLRARDDFMLALNNATLNSEGAWRQARGPAAKLATLTEGYLLTHGEDVMKMLKTTAAGGVKTKPGGFQQGTKNSKDGAFQWGLALEGLIRAWWITQDPEIVKAVQAQDDWLLEKDMIKQATTPNAALGMAFAWRQTGEQKYRDAAIELLKQVGETRRPKQFGQYTRTLPYAWYYLSNLAEKDKKP
jgi:hypothetical protein